MSITRGSKNYAGLMRITSKGQVTIPQWVRERHGLMPQTEVEFIEKDGVITLAPAEARPKPDRAGQLLTRLRGAAQKSLTPDGVMHLTRAHDDDWNTGVPDRLKRAARRHHPGL